MNPDCENPGTRYSRERTAVRSSVTWTARMTVTTAVIAGSVHVGVASPRAVKTAATAERSSTRWLRLIVVTPAARLESVQLNAASPCRDRKVSMAPRSSVTWTTRTTLESGVSVESENARLKRAVTPRAWSRTTVQAPVPLHPELHPANTEPAAGVAVSVTEDPAAKLAVQTVLHVRPAGELVTVPVPAPVTVTVSPTVAGAKVAVTVVALVGVRVQVPVPEQPPPDQPTKTAPPVGVAVSTTVLLDGKLAEQVVPHAMPAGELVTLPLPRPVRTTVTVTGAGAKAPFTIVADVSITTQVPVPEHPPPDQPVNTQPVAGVAEIETLVPDAKVAEHVLPQLIPAGELATEPLPVRVTVNETAVGAAGNSKAPMSDAGP